MSMSISAIIGFGVYFDGAINKEISKDRQFEGYIHILSDSGGYFIGAKLEEADADYYPTTIEIKKPELNPILDKLLKKLNIQEKPTLKLMCRVI